MAVEGSRGSHGRETGQRTAPVRPGPGTDDGLAAFVERMGSIFARAHAEERSEPEWSEIERLLTDGYAHALDLDAEAHRLQRRTMELAALDGGEGYQAELRSLHARHERLHSDITRLRSLLDWLRRYATELHDQPTRPPASRL